MQTWWFGVALLALLTVDVFFTVFHPFAHGGPINRWQNRLVWKGMASLAGLAPDRWKDWVLTLVGPLLALTTLLVWGLALLLGFTLIYYEFTAFLVHSDAPLESRWWSALYYSGYVGSTLGLGDVVPSEDWLRVVTVIQAFSGFMLISVAVTYILALYGAEGEAEAFAADLATFLGDEDREVVRPAGNLDRLDRWAAVQNQRFTAVLTASSQYPILHYFRPADPRQSVVIEVGRLLDLVEHVEEALHGDLSAYPAFAALRRSVELYLQGSAEQFTSPGRVSDSDGEPAMERTERRREEHARLLSHLRYEPRRSPARPS